MRRKVGCQDQIFELDPIQLSLHSVWISTTEWKFDIFMNNAIKIFLALKSLDLCGYGGTIAVFGPVDPSSNPLETRYFSIFVFLHLIHLK